MRRCLVAVLVVAGCGDDGGGATPMRDAAVDTAVDAPVSIDAPPPPAGHLHFVVDKASLPTTNPEATSLGLDLNGDGTADNQLGRVLATFASMGFEVTTSTDTMIDTGAAIMLADLGADDLTTEPLASFTLNQGANPMPPACAGPTDTVCRKHLTGSASFSIKQGAPVDPPLQGAITNGTLAAGPGHLTVQLTMFGSTPFTVTLLGARVQLVPTATGGMGKLAGAISKMDVDTHIVPAIQQGAEAAVQQECTMLSSPPTCGCPDSSRGKTLLGLFDVNPKDCTISVDEVRNNSLFVSLLSPDIVVENTMALSLGFGVRMVSAGFVAPQ